jgi:hypothetical protein
MNNPTRTTIVYALAGGFLIVPATMLLTPFLHWPTAFKLSLWTDLAIYAVLLTRWSRRSLLAVIFPLALLLGTALWPRTYAGFFFLAVGVLCWIRSGICFQDTPLRTLAAEVITVLGGCALVMLFGGQTPLSWAIAICLFSQVQALYFFIVPLNRTAAEKDRVADDPFDRAVEEARKVLEEC